MFKLGQSYKVKMSEDDGITMYPNCRVVELEMPVVKFDRHGEELIINVSSPAFISATPESN